MTIKHPLNWPGSAELLFIVILFLSLNAFAEPLIQTGFDSGADGFSYQDDSFRSTSAPAYADGSWNPTEAALQIDLGGIDKSDIFGMSGGWQRDFELGGLSEVVLSFRYNLTQSAWYESNEQSQILVSIDGVLIGVSPNDYIDQVTGNGNGGPDETTGWQSVELNLGSLSAGSHRLTLGGYNNQKTHYTEYTTLLVDDLSLNALSSNQPPTAVASATPDNGVAPLEVSFSSAGSTDADGSIQSYSWRFGDGSSATDANPSHSYTSPGSYTATLTVTDDQGGTGSASVTISVSDVPDTEAPGTPTGLSASANGPATINLSWSAATDNVGVTGYRIFRDETEIATATTTSYSDSGLDPETTYSYSVTAYDAAGNESAPGEAAEATSGALPVLTSLSLNPSSAALSVGTSQQFSASGLDQYGNAIATSPVWSVSGGGTIDQTGRFTASSAGGPFTVLADDGGISASATVTITQNTTLIETGFDSDSDGFSYVDDAYRGTSAPGFADGSHQPAGGFSGGGLEVVLGGINGDDIFGMSGGWQRDFELGGLSEVTLSFRYNLTQSPFYEDNELSQILISLDGVLIGVSPNDHIDQISGNGNGGPDETTGWQQVELNLGSLSAGTHTLILGGYNNQKTAANESTRIQLDDLLLRTTSSNQPPTAVASATPDNGVAPLEVSFSSAGSTDADGSIQSYSWRFGDGSSASEANPSHSYTSSGSYTATLTVTDDQGGTGSASVTISVSDVPDTEAPGIPTGLSASANGPATINLSWSAATDNVGVTGYRIFRDETEIATATTTSYSDSGLDPETTYSYSVTAYDAAGNESEPGEPAEATTGALPILTSLSLNPSSAALSVGTSQQFSASGLDQYGNAIATSPVWSVSGGGTIDQTGRFTASSAGGPFTVLADDGGISASATVTITQNTTLIETGFDSDSDGFSYVDDAYRGTSAPGFADGSHQPAGGFSGGGLEVVLGGINGDDIFGMSGGWQRDFELGGLSEVTLSFRYNLTQSPFYEDNELSQILISLDGVLIGVSPNDHIDQISGNGNGGPDETTGWQQVELNLGSLSAGSHRLILGGYNNQKTAANESTRIQLDDLLLRTTSSNQPPTAVASATPDNGVAPLEVSFSSAGSTDADGSIQSYSWRFGDGSSASEANPSHSYTSPGSYTATLTVTDDQGGTGSASVTISVSDVPDTEAPGTPTGLSASANGPATINLSWSAATDNVGVTGYRIFRDETEIATATTTSHSDSGLDPETTYSYSVTAYDAAGNESAPGEAAEATTGALPVLTSLSLNPSSAALSVGTSQQFSASGLDQYGNAIATSPVWSVSGGGTIDQTGRFTASSAGGPFTVLADDGGISASATVTITQNTTLIETGFDSDSDGFSYVDDAYRGTSAPGFADGSHQPAGGFSGGGLEVVLGGINGDDIFGMSGGWQRDFELGGLSEVTLSFRYNLTQSPFYEDNELSQILISLDGVLIGVSPNDHIDQISGNGNGGPDETTGWQQVELNLGSLSAGSHRLILGGYNNQKTAANESTRIQFDDLLLTTGDGSVGGGGGGGQPIDGDLVVISANDLGMHCADLDYQVFSILPPFNVVHAQVVKKGGEGQSPEILDDTQLELTYVATSSANDPVGAGSINTTSQNGEVYKSNFWEIQDANTLAYGGYGTLYPFDNGLSILSGFEHLPPDLGLPVPDLMELALGNLVVHQQVMPGISDPYNANQPQAFKRFDRDLPFFAALPFGTTIEGVNWFAADGIPLLPIDDQGRSNAYPLMTITAVDKATGEDLASTDIVVPVASEADCVNCHGTTDDGYSGVAADFASVSFDYVSQALNDGEIPGPEKHNNAAKINILRLHDTKHGTDLDNQRPVQCSQCHYSPALDLAQQGPVDDDPESGGRQQTSHVSMSRAMHQHHGELMFADEPLFPQMPLPGERTLDEAADVLQATCYQCHPGKNTQCLRGAMAAGGVVCQDCHGSMVQVGDDFTENLPHTPYPEGADLSKRVPWGSEPGCGSCHTGDALNPNHEGEGLIVAPDGIRLLQAYRSDDITAEPIRSPASRFTENQPLYRLSTGHGGVMCEGCHGSTHAIFPNPMPNANDNVTATQLQGHSGTIIECETCHEPGSLPMTLGGPHGMHNRGDMRWTDHEHKEFFKDDPDACRSCHGADLLGTVLSAAAAARHYEIEDNEIVDIARGEPIGCNLCHELPEDENED